MSVVGWLAVVVGAAVALAALVAGMVATSAAATLICLIPECIGLLLLVAGLHLVLEPPRGRSR